MTDWLECTYRQHREAFFRVAWLILRDASSAEDAVHTAFSRMLRRKEQPRNPFAFSLMAVRNAAIDAKRKYAKEEANVDFNEATVAVADSRNLQGASLYLEHALNSLRPAEREVVELKLRVGLTFQEIAKLLSQPLSTVSSRYRRALAKLKLDLEVNDEA